MEFFAKLLETLSGGLITGVNGAVYYVLPFLFVLTLVVFVHELGHFLIARWCGVKVMTFSIGFGPSIFGWNDRYGTRWQVSWIPLGGYVKFLGDEDAASGTADEEAISKLSDEDKKRAFHLKPVGQRAAVVVAGPLFNFIFAIIVFATMYATVGKQTLTPRVDQVIEGGAAAQAGIKAGDVVLSINGEAIETFSDLQRIITLSSDEELQFKVDRGGEQVSMIVKPQRKEVKDAFGNVSRQGMVGISRSPSAGDVVSKVYDPLTAIKLGVRETYHVIDRTLVYMWRVIAGRESADQIGGPLRIAQISGQVASVSYVALINLAAVLSVSIGLINLFPIPLMDGGHLVFYAIEAIRGKPLSETAQEWGFRFGLAIVLMLMVFATVNDIKHLFAL